MTLDTENYMMIVIIYTDNRYSYRLAKFAGKTCIGKIRFDLSNDVLYKQLQSVEHNENDANKLLDKLWKMHGGIK